MSLKEAYSLAHTAQCRLNIQASRPDRNLRFVVGHLMTYEKMRLRIVEIEHDISKSRRASTVAFQGTGHVDHRLQAKPSTGDLRRKKSPPPPPTHDDDDDNSSDSDDFPDDFDEELTLERFPSGAARQCGPPPGLEPDDMLDDDSDEDEPVSPDEPNEAVLEQTVKGDENELLATMYEGVRKCVCHGKTEAPKIERMWELPTDAAGAKEGFTRAVAQVA